MSEEEIPPAEIKVPYDQFQISSYISWVECNGYKPYLHIDTGHPGVRLPLASSSKEMEVINVSTSAVYKMQWFDDRLEFNARFGGRDYRLVIPYHAIKVVSFAGTQTAVPTPWVNLRIRAEPGTEPTQTSSPVEAPPREDVKEAPQETSAPESDAPSPPSNVRTVDFRAPRKPKS